jgi:hypothetical protein
VLAVALGVVLAWLGVVGLVVVPEAEVDDEAFDEVVELAAGFVVDLAGAVVDFLVDEVDEPAFVVEAIVGD